MSSQERGVPAIIGVGYAQGEVTITNQEIGRRMWGEDANPKKIGRFMSPVGIDSRRWVKPPENIEGRTLDEIAEMRTATSDLGLGALRMALQMANRGGDELRFLAIGTSTPDYAATPVGPIIQRKLGLSSDLHTYDVSAACPAWLHALQATYLNRLAGDDGDGGLQAAIGAEVISPMLIPSKYLLYPLFGDAAGAVVIDMVIPDNGAPSKWAFSFGTDGTHPEKLGIRAGGSLYPASQKTIEQDLHTINMDGPYIKQRAVECMVEASKAALDKGGYASEDVAWVIPHQANLEIMKDTMDAAGMPQEKMVVTIDTFGNTSAATMPSALAVAWERGQVKRNDVVLFTTFGGGLTYGAAVIPMNGLPPRRS